jgi:monoamine oxidase
MAARSVLHAGLEPIVLEARGRVGGRVVNEPIGDGKIVEMGGQWAAPRNHLLRSVAADFGATFFPTYDRGANLLEISGEIRRQRGKLPPLRAVALLDVAVARLRLDRQAREVAAIAPWAAPRARELDNQTLGTWLGRAVRSREGRALLDIAMTTIWAAAPHQVNLLQALAYIRGAGNFAALATSEVALRVVGGSARLAYGLAAELGERVVCASPVTTVVDRGAAVEVEVEGGGTRVRARRAIIAVPPALAAGIRFDPELPPVREQALRSLPMGAVTKVAAVYDRPFWRDRGLSGQAFTAQGPVTATFDNSPPDGSPGVLLGFVPGDRARTLAKRGEAERRDAVLATFTRLFGPQASRPRAYLEKDWLADPWTLGCYFGLATPGAMTGVLRTLREPIGRIHWAGAETALENYGGMDGALSSGERAAAEVLAALPSTVGQPA